MIRHNYISLLFIILLITPVQAVSIIPASKDYWTCYDYSVDYAKNNTEWGIVTMSDNQYFHGVSHMVNYKFGNNNSLMIHDGLYNLDYTLYVWQDCGKYMHFWDNSTTPQRYYKIMQDNRAETYNALCTEA